MSKLSTKNKEWKEYENIIFEECKTHFPNSSIKKNVTQKGIFSKRKRQIDILIKQDTGNQQLTTIVECKHYSRKIDVKIVESFIGMMEDLNANRGILITEKGYTKTALDRAHFNPRHLELDIYSLSDFKAKFQASSAILYTNNISVYLIAPFGYCIDGRYNNYSLCTLYQRGMTFNEALKNHEFSYVNFAIKNNQISSISTLNSIQISEMNNYYETCKFDFTENELPRKESTFIRIVHYNNKPFIELTGFVEFNDFIFFSVWFCKKNTIKRNLRKLETLLINVSPIIVNKTRF